MRIFFAAVAFAIVSAPALAGGGMSSGLSDAAHRLEKPTCAKGDPVVWLNTKYNAYFPESSPYYAHTRDGQFICQSDAVTKGAHLSKTVSQPSDPPAASPSP